MNHYIELSGAFMRRKSLIDKKFQLKTTFRIIGINIIAFIFVIGVTGIISTDNNRKITDAISDLNRSIEKESRTVETLVDSSGNARGSNQTKRDERLIDDHLETVALMHTTIQHLQKITYRNLVLITSMIVTGILLGIFLFIYLIRLTSRISGPIYVLTKHIKDVLAGSKPDLRGLRKHDEFKEFYNQFVEFIRKK
jgi:predicted PurR-regulated permease PerM